MILGFPEYAAQTKRLAEAADLPWSILDIHHFPDGESQLKLPVTLPDQVILCRSLDHPNDKLVELLLAAQGARNLGAKKVSLVAPYLCYMRQDKAFHPGEVVSQKIMGQLLADHFDGVLTVDAHLHRIKHLQEAIPIQQAINITATAPMATFIQAQVQQPYLLGPDAESEQWVAAIAEPHHLDYGVAHKDRLGDRAMSLT